MSTDDSRDLLADAFACMTMPQQKLIAARAATMADRAPEPFNLIWKAVHLSAVSALAGENA